MTSCPKAMGWDSWVFWKKQFGEIWTKTSPVVCCGVHVRCLGQWVESWHWKNSQHSKNCVPLSSCWKPKSQERNKSLERNKSFLPEPRESSVFRVFFGFLRFYISVHFTYPYHGYITTSLVQLYLRYSSSNLRSFTHRYMISSIPI